MELRSLGKSGYNFENFIIRVEMKKVFLVAVFFFLLATKEAFGLDLYINSGRENGENFAVLNLVNDVPFSCKEEYSENSEVKKIICSFDEILVSRFAKSNTLFFVIDPKIKGDTFSLEITPKKKIKLFHSGEDLKILGMIPKERVKTSTHWQILGYSKKIPFLEKKSFDGINFPISFEAMVGLPSIGALDFKMTPMEDEVGPDKNYFLRIKDFMNRESYKDALALIDETFSLYPQTIFKRDILHFKIVGLDGLEDLEQNEEIVSLAKAWLDAYPADINAPQVLYILGKTYANMLFFDEGKYYYMRLFNEYKGNKFEYLARLDYADRLYERGDREVSKKIYESVLDETKDVNVATQAALRLAEFYKKEGDKKQASEYLKTIYEANLPYFGRKIDKNYEMLQKYADSQIYEYPAKILEYMLNKLEKENKDYKNMLLDVGDWYDKSKNLPKAHEYYQRFLSEYSKEQEAKEIKKKDDYLLLQGDLEPSNEKLKHYDYVMDEYKGKEEAKIALEQKAKTLFALKKYEEVFALRESLGDENQSLLESLKALTLKALDEKNCKEASYYGALYDDRIPLGETKKMELFDCLFENKQYDSAQKIAENQAANAKDVSKKEGWLYRLGWVEYERQNYPKAALAMRDVVTFNNVSYKDSIWVLFMALKELKRDDEAFELLPKLEENLEDDVKMIEVYRFVLQKALAKKDDNAIKSYARRLIALQEKHLKHEYSPWVEFSITEALVREGDFKNALDYINKAYKKSKTPQEQIQTLYLQGYLNTKLDNVQDAIKAYEGCLAVNAQSPWKNLCKDAKEILDKKIPKNTD